MKMYSFQVAKAGSTNLCVIHASCVTKACQKFIETLDRPCGASFEVVNTEHARIVYLDNHTIMSDFVVDKL